ncbi:hypothetical protein BTO23_18080 [Aliivibrio sifiae]|uniref:Membrane protein n=2 Tax=Aliivibrio sifiae TaxID=566293 RepID=A0A2S7X9H5_9GAMM|nr:hypothetical protein BTO23_18080 [Aliivibrio sifiae]GLR73635.1 membrane protein [Aliivibrio sifiae]
MNFIKKLVILSPLFMATFSQANEMRKFYAGIGVGSTTLNDYDDLFNTLSVDEDGNTFKFIAGYQFNRIVALEAQYTKYGDINVTTPLFGGGNTYSWSPESLSIAANVGYTFNNGLRPFGIAGLSSIDINESKKALNDEKYIGFHYGFGVEYTPQRLNSLSLRVGYEADLFFADEEVTYLYSDITISEDHFLNLSSLYISAAYRF